MKNTHRAVETNPGTLRIPLEEDFSGKNKQETNNEKKANRENCLWTKVIPGRLVCVFYACVVGKHRYCSIEQEYTGAPRCQTCCILEYLIYVQINHVECAAVCCCCCWAEKTVRRDVYDISEFTVWYYDQKNHLLGYIFMRNCLFLLQLKNPTIHHHTSTCRCIDYSPDYWYSLYFITLKLVLWLLLSHINFCQTCRSIKIRPRSALLFRRYEDGAQVK